MPQKAAPRGVFAPLFDVVVWHWSCESSHAEGSHFSQHREGAVSEGRKRIIRIVVAGLGLTALLALQPESPRLVASAWARGEAARGPVVRKLILSDQARRYLALQYRSYSTEFMGCMIGETRGSAVVVRRIAPADVEPRHSTPTRVVPHQTCEDAGWSGTVGMIHSHPSGERCWYFFPGTQVASSDGQSFAGQPYPVDAIMCGDHVVWINRDMAEAQLPLVADSVRQPFAPVTR